MPHAAFPRNNNIDNIEYLESSRDDRLTELNTTDRPAIVLAQETIKVRE